MRLYDKRATEEQITKEVTRLLLGDTEQYPLSVSEVAATLGYSRDNVYNYVKKAVKNGLLEYGKNGYLVIPTNKKSELGYRQFDKNHQITADPLVAEWKQDLLTRKQGEAQARGDQG
jgi:predicted DNA-binding protein YlxM (UPF0122 family)